MTAPLRIFIGYDPAEAIAYHVLAQSLIRHASVPVTVTPLVQARLRESGIYSRERGPTESTEFSLTRFLVPALCGFEGRAAFMDCDMLCQTDISALFAEASGDRTSVWVAPHDFSPTATVKFLGRQQTAYPRKCWSSVMVFDCARCTALTPDYVNRATGLELHRFQWAADEAVGSLALDWGWLVGVYAANPGARLLHWTEGGPWFDATSDADHADLWRAELRRLPMSFVAHPDASV